MNKRIYYYFKIGFGILFLIFLCFFSYLYYLHDEHVLIGKESFLKFMTDWGSFIGIVASIIIALLIAIIPTSIDKKIDKISESLQFPLNDFSQIYYQTIELLKWVGVEEGSEFFITSATPIFGIELGLAERKEWSILLDKRIQAGSTDKIKTTMICLDWKPNNDFLNSPLYIFCKGLQEHNVLVKSDLNTGIMLFKRSIETYLEFQKYSESSGFELFCGSKPQAQIVLATKSNGEQKGIIYFTTMRSNRTHSVSGLRSSDNNWINIMRNILAFQKSNSRKALIDFSNINWDKEQMKRCFDLFEYQVVHPERYLINCFDKQNICVFPGVFPPEIGLSTQLLINSINEICIKLTTNNTKLTGIDVGTGTGILALYLADYCEEVHATDIFNTAVENAKHNCKNNPKIKVYNCNLIEQIEIKNPENFPIIVFNYPFYPSPLAVYNPNGDEKAGKIVIKEFLIAIRNIIEKRGIAIMPYSSIAADNNPLNIATKLGFKTTLFKDETVDGIENSIYLITNENYIDFNSKRGK
jgi:methylase of polypeptide subunit release factors